MLKVHECCPDFKHNLKNCIYIVNYELHVLLYTDFFSGSLEGIFI